MDFMIKIVFTQIGYICSNSGQSKAVSISVGSRREYEDGGVEMWENLSAPQSAT